MTEPLATPPDLPQKGERIAGKYLVEEVLGAGGMGVVVAARHIALRQRVAVKFLLPAALRLPEARERFLREAQAAVAIQSEHVARVIDVGTLETGAPYMVMEYLAGIDFSRLLKQRGALPVAEAVDYVLQAGEAIAEAHMLGIIHRDLKPANLFLTSRAEGSPLVKVLDFGLSKMTLGLEETGEASLTATSAIVGSPQYMSPEQIRSLKHVGIGTDLWALGVILHEMLTGRRPFEGRTLTAISASIVADTPPPVRSLRPDLPEGLDAVILACLEKDAARRLQSVAELAARLAPFAPPSSGPSLERIAKLTPARPQARPPAPPAPPADDDAERTRAYVTGGELWGPSAAMPITESAILSAVPERTIALPVESAQFLPPVHAPAPAPYPPPAGPGIAAPWPAPAVEPEADANAWGQTKPQGRRLLPAAFAAGGVLGLVLLLALVGWFALGSGKDAPAPAPAAATAATTTAAVPVVPPPPVKTAETPPPVPAPTAPTATASAVATAAPQATAAPSPRPAPTARPAAPPPRRGSNPLDRSD